MREQKVFGALGHWAAMGLWVGVQAACGGDASSVGGADAASGGGETTDARPGADTGHGGGGGGSGGMGADDAGLEPGDASTEPPVCRPVCQTGCSTGDPHLTTFDGVYYDFQAEGEFTVVHADDGTLEVQVRQEKTSACAGAALNGAVAVRSGDARVMVTRAPAAFVRLPDGRSFPLGGIDLDLGALQVTDACDGVRITTTAGDEVFVSLLGGDWLNLEVVPAASRQGAVGGLFGDFDGEPEGDVQFADGTAADPSWESVYTRFLTDWQVTAETSAFVYGEGESVETFARGAPLEWLDPANLAPETLAAAETACVNVADPALHRACVLDVLCLGGDAGPTIATFEETLPFEVYFDVAPPVAETPPEALVDAATVVAEQVPVEGVYTWACPPLSVSTGHLWGTDVYTDDSYICEAAVHAGVTVQGVGGPVRFQSLPGQDTYTGSLRHGITSWDWGAWGASFSFVP
jgi:hypothetical protein